MIQVVVLLLLIWWMYDGRGPRDRRRVLGGDAQWVIWTAAGALLWVTPWLATFEGFVVSPSHFVERHGLVVIVALGESIVVIGAGAGGARARLGARARGASLPRLERFPLVDVLQ